MPKINLDHEELNRAISHKAAKNDLLRALGLPQEQFSTNEMAYFFDKINSCISKPASPITPGPFNQIQAQLLSDPQLTRFLEKDIQVLDDFYKVSQHNHQEIDDIKNIWQTILLYLNETNAYDSEGTKDLFIKVNSERPNFMRFSLLIPEVFQLIEENMMSSLSLVLDLPGFNPLESSIKQTCYLINKKNSTFTTLDNYANGRMLPLPQAKKLSSFGFNFDWLMVFDDVSFHKNKLDNSILSALYIYMPHYKKITTLDYLDFIYSNSQLLKTPGAISIMVDFAHNNALNTQSQSSSNFLKFRDFGEQEQSLFLNTLTTKHEHEILNQNVAIKPALSRAIKI